MDTHNSGDEGDRKPAAKETSNSEARRGNLEHSTNVNNNNSKSVPLSLKGVQAAWKRSDNDALNENERSRRERLASGLAFAVAASKAASEPASVAVAAKNPESNNSLANGNDKPAASMNGDTVKHLRPLAMREKDAEPNSYGDTRRFGSSAEQNNSKRRKFNATRQMDELERETRQWHFRNNAERLQNTNVKSFSLKFNDISVAAICKWTAGTKKLGENKEGVKEARKKRAVFNPSVDVNFRHCGICKCWGAHYEIECPFIDGKHSLRFSREIKATAPKVPKRAVAEIEWGPLVEIEECDGFIVEQRAVPYSEVPDSPKVQARKSGKQFKQSKPVVNFVDDFVIRASEAVVEAAPIIQSTDIAVGDVVYWYSKNANDARGAATDKTINTGMIVKRNKTSGEALVRYLVAISPSSTVLATRDSSLTVGTTYWIPVERLTKVVKEEEPPPKTSARSVAAKNPRRKKAPGSSRKRTKTRSQGPSRAR